MANFKINLTNEQEGKIAAYCAENNIELNDANVYETTLETFKEKPIIYIERDQHTGEEVEHNVTPRIARYIECQPRTIERIVAKVDLYKRKLQTNLYECNIAKAKIDTHPDINKLVENLYRLNIVDGNSYLGLVCFLMQLKYSRDAEIREDDKSCVFFNGVARNGKSATAKAICEIEAQYGKVFKVQSGKVLESTHEEQVWTSHLNFFDEVKPTDVDRELLLTIVNGGNVEINPKNKKHYNYYVNTNNIFTSNDQINLKQRRVSVIKFGNRLNGRPLEGGTLSKIITNIMNSLPDFEHYYNIYNIVSIYNENRVNPLAVESIITFMSSKMGFVNETEGRTLTAEITFAPHDIYNCIKNAYNKQIITSERQEAIRTVLNMFAEKKLIEEVKYEKCTTTNYRVTGENYLKIVNEYQKINTKYEQNVKITKNGLYDILSPFFTNAISTNEDDKSQKPILIEGKDLCNAHESLIKFVDDSVYNTLHSTKTYKISVSDNVRQKGTQLFYILLKHLKTLIDESQYSSDCFIFRNYTTVDDVLNEYITKEVCKYISCEGLIRMLKEEVIGFGDSHDQLIKDLYFKHLGITDEKTFKMMEECKLSYIPKGTPDGMTIQDSWSYNHQQYKLQKEKKRLEAAEYRRKRNELKKEQELEKQRLLSSKAM